MGEINVNSEGLRSVATKFASASVRCMEMQKQIETSTNDMMIQWIGNGKNAFEPQFDTICKNMNTYANVLKDISSELTTIAKEFEDRDLLINNDLLKYIK